MKRNIFITVINSQKIIIILFLFMNLFSFKLIFGQSGTTFAPNYSHWSQGASFYYTPGIGQPPVCVCNYQQTQIYGDTIINNKFLQKLDSSNFQTFDSLCLNTWIFIYTDSNRVFAGINPTSLNLTYDFNLVIGDSFTFNAVYNTPFPNTYTVAVDTADSVNIGGLLRKRIKFTPIPFHPNDQTPIQWVEGIGDYTYGWVLDYGFIVYANYVNNGGCALTCFTDNNSTTFGNCLYGNCVVYIHENTPGSFTIHPNPANNKIFINSEIDLRNLKVQIFNTLGKIIFESNYSSISNSHELNISSLPNGFYLVSLTQNEQTKVYKIIIQH